MADSLRGYSIYSVLYPARSPVALIAGRLRLPRRAVVVGEQNGVQEIAHRRWNFHTAADPAHRTDHWMNHRLPEFES